MSPVSFSLKQKVVVLHCRWQRDVFKSKKAEGDFYKACLLFSVKLNSEKMLSHFSLSLISKMWNLIPLRRLSFDSVTLIQEIFNLWPRLWLYTQAERAVFVIQQTSALLSDAQGTSLFSFEFPAETAHWFPPDLFSSFEIILHHKACL